jgi:hypothetical protein
MQKADIATIADSIYPVASEHSSEFLPYGTGFQDAEKLREMLKEKSPVYKDVFGTGWDAVKWPPE